jgi:5-formyltetrahydrofolate cyclo-ligase
VRARAIDRQTFIAERKAALRAEASALRRKVWLNSGANAREALAESGAMQAQCAAGYFPLPGEFDPLPLLGALHEQGLRLALPVVRPGPDLIFREWQPGAPLKRGKSGLQEPSDAYPELVPDIVLVPLLAFDRAGNRLGYGKGYYDAASRKLRRRGKVAAIGIGFDEQEFAQVPRAPQDEPMDMILTPSRVIACGA